MGRAYGITALLLLALFATSEATRVGDFLMAAEEQLANNVEDFMHAVDGQNGAMIKDDDADKKLFVLVKYVIKPSIQKEWVEMWLDTKAAVEKETEGGAKIYLSKPLTDTVTFYSAGTWDSMEAFKEYMQSDAVKKLIKYNVEHDIVAFITPMLSIEGDDDNRKL